MIYVPHEKAWFKPSQCVWAGPHVKIPGKACIAESYSQKKTFFTVVLKVVTPTVEMYVASLRNEAQKKTAASKLKEIMVLISNLGVKSRDVEGLQDTPVFPVRTSGGEIRLSSASSSFVILDTVAHRSAFESKITALDFSLEEIRDTKPFLLANGFQDRFSTMLVEEVTDVKAGEAQHEVAKGLRLKAKAVVR